MVTEHHQHRDFHPFPPIERVPEHGSLGDRQPHIEADHDERGARQERNAPTEGEELFVGEPPGQRQEDATGEEESGWRAELWKHAVPGALPRRRILDREQHRAAPLTTEAQALAEATEREEERRSHADGGVGRQGANGDSGDPHREQRRDQCRLPADAVAEVTKEGRADGSCQERNREGRQRGERG